MNLHSNVDAFIPSDLIESFLKKVGSNVYSTLDNVTDTITHDDIIERGLAQSIADFYYNQTNGSLLISPSKYGNEYNDIKAVFYDYFGLWLCDLDTSILSKTVFRPNVAIVDVLDDTKDNPYYHFDAERMREANVIVMNATNYIYGFLANKDYETARKLTARVLHIIQDFYSHSNWVENGNTNINDKIGTAAFDSLLILNTTEANPCVNNCTQISVACSTFLDFFNAIYKLVFSKSFSSCPVIYYKCYGNLATNKLVSGYYGGQKLTDGTSVPKPTGLNKCSHGGIYDSTSTATAEGGINKDTGFFLISPHAYLHLSAANLATQHTRYFFNQIRSQIGDTEYVKFLSLKLPSTAYNNSDNYKVRTCVASRVYHNYKIILIFTIILLTYFNN